MTNDDVIYSRMIGFSDGFQYGLYFPIGICLLIIRLGLLFGLIFLRLVLTFLQGNQSQITCQITRFYLISCGLFVIQTGDKSKEGTRLYTRLD